MISTNQHILEELELLSKRNFFKKNYFKIGKLVGAGSFSYCFEGSYRKNNVPFDEYTETTMYDSVSTEYSEIMSTNSEYFDDSMGRLLPRTVLLKFYKKKFDLSDQKFLQILKSDIMVLTKELEHKNLPKIYGMSRPNQDSTMFIVQDLVMGKSMQYVLDKCPSFFNQYTIILYSAQILDVMSYLHSKKIVHLDIKPNNIIIESNLLVCKLIDFGKCQEASILNENQYVNQNKEFFSSIVGTIPYTAPEIFTLKHGINDKADIYSFGITLWQMVNKRYPYSDFDDSSMLIFSIINNKIRPNFNKRHQNMFKMKNLENKYKANNINQLGPEIKCYRIDTLLKHLKKIKSKYHLNVNLRQNNYLGDNRNQKNNQEKLMPDIRHIFNTSNEENQNFYLNNSDDVFDDSDKTYNSESNNHKEANDNTKVRIPSEIVLENVFQSTDTASTSRIGLSSLANNHSSCMIPSAKSDIAEDNSSNRKIITICRGDRLSRSYNPNTFPEALESVNLDLKTENRNSSANKNQFNLIKHVKTPSSPKFSSFLEKDTTSTQSKNHMKSSSTVQNIIRPNKKNIYETNNFTDYDHMESPFLNTNSRAHSTLKMNNLCKTELKRFNSEHKVEFKIENEIPDQNLDNNRKNNTKQTYPRNETTSSIRSANIKNSNDSNIKFSGKTNNTLVNIAGSNIISTPTLKSDSYTHQYDKFSSAKSTIKEGQVSENFSGDQYRIQRYTKSVMNYDRMTLFKKIKEEININFKRLLDPDREFMYNTKKLSEFDKKISIGLKIESKRNTKEEIKHSDSKSKIKQPITTFIRTNSFKSLNKSYQKIIFKLTKAKSNNSKSPGNSSDRNIPSPSHSVHIPTEKKIKNENSLMNSSLKNPNISNISKNIIFSETKDKLSRIGSFNGDTKFKVGSHGKNSSKNSFKSEYNGFRQNHIKSPRMKKTSYQDSPGSCQNQNVKFISTPELNNDFKKMRIDSRSDKIRLDSMSPVMKTPSTSSIIRRARTVYSKNRLNEEANNEYKNKKDDPTSNLFTKRFLKSSNRVSKPVNSPSNYTLTSNNTESSAKNDNVDTSEMFGASIDNLYNSIDHITNGIQCKISNIDKKKNGKIDQDHKLSTTYMNTVKDTVIEGNQVFKLIEEFFRLIIETSWSELPENRPNAKQLHITFLELLGLFTIT